jgi:hypothetical protein
VCTEENFKKANYELIVSCDESREEFIFATLLYNKNESLRFEFERGPAIGLGTRFSVKNEEGCVVLAAKRAIHNIRTRAIEEAAYTAYSPELDTEEMREEGKNYLLGVIWEAQNRLYEKGVSSRAFDGLVAAFPTSDSIAFNLALIEHIDPKRARSHESISQLINEVLVTLGANREGAYRYARSPKSAHGLFQFTERTYKLLLKEYPEAVLVEDFIDGAEDHVNIAQAAFLLFDLDTSTLPPRTKKLLFEKSTHRMEYIAASYNGGSGRALRAMRKDGTLRVKRLFLETQLYMNKFRSVNKVFQ